MSDQVFNPYLPSWEYIPDAEPRVFGDRLYVYGSHDRFGGTEYCQNNYVGWSAPLANLSQWTCHGVVYSKTQDPANERGRRELWAPDVVQGGDGRYYLFYCLSNHPRVSIAVSDCPAGPFEFFTHLRSAAGGLLGASSGDVFPFDPAVLVDDDGRVFLYIGFAPVARRLRRPAMLHGLLQDGAYVFELEPDMRTVKTGPRLIIPRAGHSAGSGFEGHEFYEAASIRKIDDRYYFVYSSINGDELCYATSDSPDGGFSFEGTLVSNGDIGFEGRIRRDAVNYTANNHGGLAQIDGRWYVFYHRHTNRCQVSRQGCAEPIELGPDGRFTQVEMSSGGLHSGPLPGNGTYRSHIACVLRGRDGAKPTPFRRSRFSGLSREPFLTQTGGDREGAGDQYIANMRDGAVAGFKYFDISEPTTLTLETRGSGRGMVEVSDSLAGPPIATVPVGPDVSCAEARIDALNPRMALYFRYRGTDTIDFHSFTLAPVGRTAIADSPSEM
ncbi:family 43 glycosylhydrolase [Nocardia tengchongensis]|uniref:family 43 glycosylhydrolase n=1 Tax=Nocardia tengchongensis TaxID=2055889 RepID=UPI00369B1699